MGVVVLVAAVMPLAGQSSHLTRLEASVPAVATDAVGSLAMGGWASAWLAPAAGDGAVGVLGGVEHTGFSAMTTFFAAVRADLGPLVQLRVGQTNVRDLFDDALLTEFPGLGTLRAAATQVGLDAIVEVGRGAAVAVGGQYERDEFLGDAATVWVARASASGPDIAGVRSAVAVERRISGGRADDAGFGRLRLGLARRFGSDRLAITLGAGTVIGDLWARSRRRAASGVLRVTFFNLMTLSGAVGAERDPFENPGWLGFASLGVGLTLGPLAANVRRGGMGAGEAAPTAVSVLYEPN